MTKDKIEIGRAILNFLSIISDACSQENILNFLAGQRGYKKDAMNYVVEQLVNYNLVGSYEKETETLLFITLKGNYASGIGLKSYIKSLDNPLNGPKLS